MWFWLWPVRRTGAILLSPATATDFALPPCYRLPLAHPFSQVWNKGVPPVPERDFDSAVPVRVRVERLNSLNNRFREDPLIRNRWVWRMMSPCF